MKHNLIYIISTRNNDINAIRNNLKEMRIEIGDNNIICVDNYLGNWLRNIFPFGRQAGVALKKEQECTKETGQNIMELLEEKSDSITFEEINKNKASIDQLFTNLKIIAEKILLYKILNEKNGNITQKKIHNYTHWKKLLFNYL